MGVGDRFHIFTMNLICKISKNILSLNNIVIIIEKPIFISGQNKYQLSPKTEKLFRIEDFD